MPPPHKDLTCAACSAAGFIATIISTVLPLWESKDHLIMITKNVLSCKAADTSVHAGDMFADRIGADTSKVRAAACATRSPETHAAPDS